MARTLCVTTPFMRGQDVLAVQRILARLGFSSGTIDGAYGPLTEAAVRRFQRSAGLVVDGVVGPLTSVALETADQPPFSQPSAPGQLALAEALRHVGLRESPPGSNQTPFGQWYGIDGVKWCCIFASYCFAVGASRVLCDGFRGSGVRRGRGCAYVPTLARWLRDEGLWVPRQQPPAPGDLVVFNLRGDGPDHVGLCKGTPGDGVLDTVEGNTSLDSDSDGGQVMVRKRRLAVVEGFGRVS
jgi:hypothetical protein